MFCQDRFVDNVRKLSLVCVRFVMPQYPAYEEAGWAEEDIQALTRLPNKLPLMMPTLRYIAWATLRASSDREWYESEYDCAPGNYDWYRVTSEGRLETMSAWEGERVRRFLLAGDLDRISRMNGTEHLA